MILYLILILISISEGVTHVEIFLRLGWLTFKWNIHKHFTIDRILQAASLMAAFIFGWYHMLIPFSLALLTGLLSFPFFHEGTYYQVRNWLGDKTVNWKYSKKVFDKYSAKINLGFGIRLILLVISIIIWMIYYIFLMV